MKEFLRNAYFLVRSLFIRAVRLLVWPRSGRPDLPSRILIIRLDRLGDFVLTLPVIENIKLRYPDAKVTVLVRPYLAELALSIDAIDDAIVYDGFFKTARAVRDRSFDIAIDMLCDYLLRPALIAFLSGAPVRVGFAGGSREILFSAAVAPGDGTRPMVDTHLDVLRALGIPAPVATPRIILKGFAAPRSRIVAVHPGGHYPSQRWPAERFADVAGMIARAYDVDILVIGGPEERSLVGDIMGRLADVRAQSVFPDMKEMAFLLARVSLLLCNNSGPLHLAAALGTPTVSTMGPTDPALWWPRGEDQVVIRKDLPCSPCGLGVCASHACLNGITAEEMFEKARTILDHTHGITRRSD